MLVNCIGGFSRRQFVDVATREGECSLVRFGYTVLGFHLFYLQTSADSIRSVYWHSGQATSLAGKDMNDWSVMVLYRRQKPKMDERGAKWKRMGIHVVGPSGARDRMQDLGRSFVAFLQLQGVPLVPTDDPDEFVRAKTASLGGKR